MTERAFVPGSACLALINNNRPIRVVLAGRLTSGRCDRIATQPGFSVRLQSPRPPILSFGDGRIACVSALALIAPFVRWGHDGSCGAWTAEGYHVCATEY